jgi:hypothetical protein
LTAITNTNFLGCQSNRFVDNSSSAHTITPSGNPKVSAFGPFLTSSAYDAGVNGASAYFVNEVGEYLDTPASSDFAFGTGDFTVEFWFYQEVSGYRVLIDQVYGNLGISIWINDSRQLVFYYDDSAGGGFGVATTAAVNYNEWNHVALVRSSGVTRIYANGVSGATYSDSNNYTSTTGLTVSADYNVNTYLFKGYMSDVRTVKGTAVYTSNFTPPTAPLTTVTNTKLLLNMADGQAIDSAAQRNLTLYNGAKISSTQSKFGGTSLALDGTDDYLTFGPNGITIRNDFTIEAFAYTSTIEADQCLFGSSASDDSQVFRINYSTADNILVYADGAFMLGNSSSPNTALSGINANTWFHLAVTRESGVCRLFVNGVLKETNSSFTNNFVLRMIGQKGYTTPAYWNGFVDEARITLGTARYTANFIPPTAAFANKGQ